MNKSAISLLALLVLTISGLAKNSSYSSEWILKNFTKSKAPFAFTLDGKESKTFLSTWSFSKEIQQSADPNIAKYLFSWRDPKSGLLVTCNVTGFNDYPAVEWTLRFKNTSKNNSPILEKARAIDYRFQYEHSGSVLLHHSNGSSGERSDFMEIDDLLSDGKNVYMTPDGGRSSDHTAFPFFNIEMPGKQGVITAIGWTGKWYADVKQLDQKSCSLNAGMERMKLILYPDEEIRTPQVCLLYWQGEDRMVGHNQFRQFILKHHSRYINGKLAELPLAGAMGNGGPEPCNENNCCTELYCAAIAQRYQKFNMVPEVLWIDAGWYTGCGSWWMNAGNWTVNKTNFPNGLKPVSDAIHAVGAKFLLWFEPERIVEGTQFSKLNPDYMIQIPKEVKNPDIGRYSSNMYLFNLGNPEACRFLINYISDFIRANGVDYYRQDFNFNPYPYWVYNDKPDRIGMSEIRYIEGLYAYWDGLIKNFPEMPIDNCASGGRRLDLEMISRSAPLWRTDYNYGEPNGYQCHTYGLNLYLPLHGTGNTYPTKYTFRSSMSTAMVCNWDLFTSALSQSVMRNFMQDFKRLRPYYYGDYYPLTPNKNITSDSIWMAYQQNRPDKGDGIVLAFRRPDCPIETLTVKLRGLEPAGIYEVFFEDSGEKVLMTGAQLISGLTLKSKEKPESLLISYIKQ